MAGTAAAAAGARDVTRLERRVEPLVCFVLFCFHYTNNYLKVPTPYAYEWGHQERQGREMGAGSWG
jgi:hypothetical protein